MKLKKLFAILTAALFVLTLAACTKTPPQEEEPRDIFNEAEELEKRKTVFWQMSDWTHSITGTIDGYYLEGETDSENWITLYTGRGDKYTVYGIPMEQDYTRSPFSLNTSRLGPMNPASVMGSFVTVFFDERYSEDMFTHIVYAPKEIIVAGSIYEKMSRQGSISTVWMSERFNENFDNIEKYVYLSPDEAVYGVMELLELEPDNFTTYKNRRGIDVYSGEGYEIYYDGIFDYNLRYNMTDRQYQEWLSNIFLNGVMPKYCTSVLSDRQTEPYIYFGVKVNEPDGGQSLYLVSVDGDIRLF